MGTYVKKPLGRKLSFKLIMECMRQFLPEKDSTPVGRDPLKLIINRKLKIKALHGRVFLESRLCAFGLHSSGRDFEISFMVSGLPSVKMPLLFEHSAFESRTLAFKSANFFSPCSVSGSQICSPLPSLQLQPGGPQ